MTTIKKRCENIDDTSAAGVARRAHVSPSPKGAKRLAWRRSMIPPIALGPLSCCWAMLRGGGWWLSCCDPAQAPGGGIEADRVMRGFGGRNILESEVVRGACCGCRLERLCGTKRKNPNKERAREAAVALRRVTNAGGAGGVRVLHSGPVCCVHIHPDKLK